jgi:hypothetical protein
MVKLVSVRALSISWLSMVDEIFCLLCLNISQDGDSLLWTVIGSSPEVQSLYVIPHEKHFVSLDWSV